MDISEVKNEARDAWVKAKKRKPEKGREGGEWRVAGFGGVAALGRL